MSDLRAAILARRPAEQIVHTPAGDVLVRAMTLACKDQVQGAALRGEPWRGYMILHCVLDPDTKLPLFGSSEIDALHALPAEFEGVIDAVLAMSALTPAEEKDLEGN